MPPHLAQLAAQLAPLVASSAAAAVAPPYGYPTLTHVRHASSYAMALDGAHKTPAWVYERLPGTAGAQQGALPPPSSRAPVKRQRSYFHADGSLPAFLQVQPSAYAGSGLDRGHLAPAASHKGSQWALDHTFRMSNVAPQVGAGFNRHYWARLEAFVRAQRARARTVHIFSGPVFAPLPTAGAGGGGSPLQVALAAAAPTTLPPGTAEELQGAAAPDGMRPGVARWWSAHPWLGRPDDAVLVGVPTAFYKVLLLEGVGGGEGAEVVAFLLPNARVAADTPLLRFAVPLGALQAAVGFEFFPALLPPLAVEAADAAHAQEPPAAATLPSGAPLLHLCATPAACELPAPDWWKRR